MVVMTMIWFSIFLIRSFVGFKKTQKFNNLWRCSGCFIRIATWNERVLAFSLVINSIRHSIDIGDLNVSTGTDAFVLQANVDKGSNFFSQDTSDGFINVFVTLGINLFVETDCSVVIIRSGSWQLSIYKSQIVRKALESKLYLQMGLNLLSTTARESNGRGS